jgi:phosphatidate cytidylyltransferase
VNGEGPASPPSRAAGLSNIQQRVLSALVLAALVLGLAWLGGWPFRIMAAAIAALVFLEWTTVADVVRSRPLLALSWGLLAICLAALVLGASATTMLLLIVASIVGAALAGMALGQGPQAALGLGYAALPAHALGFLRGDDASGLIAILFLFAVVWASDIFAYFVGRAIGGPRLAPSISPGKTQSGAAGGLAGAVVAGLVIAAAAGHPNLALAALLAAVLSAVSQAGDLFESAFKRRYGAKDSGRLIPGHGGVMDRVDGLVAAALALYLAGWLSAGADRPAQGLFPV